MANFYNFSGVDFRWEQWEDDGLPDLVDQRLLAVGTYSPSAVERCMELVDELEDRIASAGSASGVAGFLRGAVTWTDECDRRAVLRTLERLGGLRVDPLPWFKITEPPVNMRRRVLTDIERGLVRYCALANPTRAAIVGALDSGVASGELAELRASSVMIDGTGTAVGLRLGGTSRHNRSGYPQAAPRTTEIAFWAQPAFTELATHYRDDELILYGGNSPRPASRQSAVLMGARTVLTDAGLSGDATVRPLSIRNTFGRAFYDSGNDLEATAGILGHDDFMSVAREIGLREHKPRRRVKSAAAA
ncbi:MAG: hypothetical protein WC184_04370 [Acidimicrobiia bacterium]